MRRATQPRIHPVLPGDCFNSRSPCGERRLLDSGKCDPKKSFNSRSPCGERLKLGKKISRTGWLQFTLSMRRATPRNTNRGGTIAASIHALHAESDLVFNIIRIHPWMLQFTLSMRRATKSGRIYTKIGTRFNSRSPCGERRQPRCSYRRPWWSASIHALHAESDSIGVLF